MSPAARCSWWVTFWAAALVGPSCSGEGFHARETPPSGEAAAGGSTAVGGVAGGSDLPTPGGGGHSESGGALEMGGEADVGGAAAGATCTTDEGCDRGNFCREGSCHPCADFSDLASVEFGPAEPFEAINETARDEGLRFGRRLRDGVGLVYVRDFFGGTLWVTSDPLTSSGAAISTTDVFETGPLSLAQQLPEPLADFDFFFSRRPREKTEPVITRLFGAKQADDGTVGPPSELPAPFNTDGVVATYGLALSSERAVWMRNTDGRLAVQLVTSPLPPSGEPTPLSLPLPDGCGFATELDYAPWLSADGKLLLFSARRIDTGCKPATDASTHIYALELSAAGRPVGTAHVLTGMFDADVRQTDASLSRDGCELVFSAQPATSMRLYRATRRR
jgi:hypothetical protein